ncbi:MAG: hypothetical protein U5O39_15465 [Gammaproteobacteria bacterium]|nr:hypothetical protein [Gammaproteobacteria bacterium]
MGFLKVVGGQRDGERITLEEGLTKIGQPGVQVAAVSRRPQGYFLIHVDGGNDRERVPLINGEPIGFKSRKLEPGDKVEVAGTTMSYGEALGGLSDDRSDFLTSGATNGRGRQYTVG